MNILAFDASTAACSIALQNDTTIICFHKIAAMQHTQLILPEIKNLLAKNNLSLMQLDCIAYGYGPGSFTGIRIANTVAQGLAVPYDLPLIPISSLALLAQTAYSDLGYETFSVAVDAKLNQFYWGNYQLNAQGLMENLGQEQLITAAAIPADLTSLPYGLGDAWINYSQQFAHAKLTTKKNFPEIYPHARNLLPLAQSKFRNNEVISAISAIPSYLR